ncbi:hypothetical protein [Streptomyces achromogenes]|uniref:hypothetical protein n=1 Tax=Streptomyces achromogenes TaxID=67255 RepID=UPI0036821430
MVATVVRDGRPTVPRPEVRLLPGDELLLVSHAATEQEIRGIPVNGGPHGPAGHRRPRGLTPGAARLSGRPCRCRGRTPRRLPPCGRDPECG